MSLKITQTSALKRWLNWIQNVHPKPMQLGLDRIFKVAQSLQLLEWSSPVILIGGTNGKGSCTKCLEAIYVACGYRTGCYTSPHLMQYNERFCLDGKQVSDGQITQALFAVEQARNDVLLTFFEFSVLAALWLFQQHHCDVLLLEVGLGGRLDATNIVDADLAVITSISLDHMEILGETREQIAKEKAGILRAQAQLVCGDLSPPQTLLDAVERLQVKACYLHQDFYYQREKDYWLWSYHETVWDPLPIPQIKLQNAATALAVIHQMNTRLPVASSALDQGLAHVRLPGRFECHHHPMPLVLDVAHNAASADYLAHKLKAHFPQVEKRIVLVGILKDKAIADILRPLLPLVDVWLIAELNIERGANAGLVKQHLHTLGVKCCYTFASVEKAMEAALKYNRNFNSSLQLLVFGSFYTVSQARDCLKLDIGPS